MPPASSFIGILVVFIIVMTGSMYGLSVLASKMVTRSIQERLKALQQITAGQVPANWLKPFQKRVAALRRRPAGDVQFARLGKRIQQHCLRLLDEMTRYTTNIHMADSETTQKEMVAYLKAQQAAWPAKDWRDWIAYVEALDTSSAVSEDSVGR
ncbi:MAG TPA: hypothetical protein PLQ66_10050 [Anaerolineae bacterium]|nr:hypothetical protein [Anaerolineae bacterium]